MASFTRNHLFAGALSVAATVTLAACSGTTYGTGKSPGLQTLEDVFGIASLSGPKKETIDYKPRPPVVAPPTTAALPPPGGGAVVASNWPDDPDERAKKLRADSEQLADDEESRPLNSKDPVFKLPPRPKSDRPNPALADIDASEAAHTTRAQAEQAKKLLANARGTVAVDENGNPVRRYLSEPPSEYLASDPDSPVEIADKPKKKRKLKWPWQWFSN